MRGSADRPITLKGHGPGGNRGIGSEGYRVIEVIGGRAITLPVGETLHDLARRVACLSPSHRDPERFHEDKSEIVAELHRLARKVRHG